MFNCKCDATEKRFPHQDHSFECLIDNGFELVKVLLDAQELQADIDDYMSFIEMTNEELDQIMKIDDEGKIT